MIFWEKASTHEKKSWAPGVVPRETKKNRKMADTRVEMARVTRDGGVVAACVWDFTDGGPIGPFWDAARALDPEVEAGSVCPGSRAGHLADLFRAAGIGDIVDSAVAVDVEHATFEDWWEPFTLGVAPSGAHVAGLEPDRRTALRELCRERLPEPPFVVSAKAWVARGAA